MITVVGKIIADKRLVGFRVVYNDTLDVDDVTYSWAVDNIRKFTNLRADAGKLLGKSGRLEKYGVVGMGRVTYTIISALVKEGKRVGFEVSDSNGNIESLNLWEMAKIYENGLATNCRLNKNGLSLIKGTFIEKKYS